MKRIALILLSFLGLFFLVSCADQSAKSPLDSFRGIPDKQIYADANSAFAKGDFSGAIKNYEAFVALYPYNKNRPQAELNLMAAYNLNGNIDQTIDLADRYIAAHQLTNDGVDYAYYIAGVSWFEKNFTWLDKIYARDQSLKDMDSFQKAFFYFDKVVRNYPNSRYASDAYARMFFIRNLIAKAELRKAAFYLQKKAYIAALDRAFFIINKMPNTVYYNEAINIARKARAHLDISNI